MRQALVTVAAVAAMAHGQWRIRLDPDDTVATVVFLGGALAAALALGGGAADPLPGVVPRRRGRAARAAGVVAVLLGLGATAGSVYLLATDWSVWFTRAGAGVLAGVLLLSLGLAAFDPPPPRDRPWSRGEVIGLVVILALGTFLRFHRFEEVPGPYTMHAIEEPQTGTGGYRILVHGVRPWEFMGDHYLAALGMRALGGPTIRNIRLPFTVFSALTVLPMHLWLRQIAQPPAALAGTFLFAVASWNLLYSRCAHNIFLTNIVVVTVVAMLLAYARSRRLVWAPWAGLLCGYTLYAYAGYRGTTFLALAFIGALGLRALWYWRRGPDERTRVAARRAFVRDLAAGTIVLSLAAALLVPVLVLTISNRADPWYYFEAANRSLSNRSYYTSDVGAFVRQRVERLEETLRIFSHVGDRSNTFNKPGEPMLDPVTAIAFAGGLAVAVLHPARRCAGFFLFMFAFLLAGSAVFVQNLDVRRMQGITPLVAVFATLFLDRVWALLGGASGSGRRRLLGAVALAVGAGVGWWNYDVYFSKMATDPAVREAFRNHYMHLIRFGRTEGAGRELLVATFIKHFFEPSDYFWLIDGQIRGRVLPDLAEILPPRRLPPAADARTVVVQGPYDGTAAARLLTAVYPGVRCRDIVDPDSPRLTLVACDLPPEPVPRPLTTTLRARYWLGDATTADAPLVERSEPFIDAAFVPAACHDHRPPEGPPTCEGEWTGTFVVPPGGSEALRLVPLNQTRAEGSIDGTPLVPGVVGQVGPGAHTVVVRARWPRSGEEGVRLERLAGNGAEALPFYRVNGGESG